MDVLRSDQQAGNAPVAASTTEVWSAQDAMPAVPDAAWHSVKLRVIIERYADGATNESTALETVLRPAELFERPVALVHFPRPWPGTLTDAATDPNAVGNAAVSVREWIPVLEVGSQLVAQAGFTDSGDFIPDPLSANRDITGAGGAGFMSGFGEALGGGEAAASSLTAEWLDFEIHVPGEQSRNIRRPVFDPLGPGRRSARVSDVDASTNERLIARYEALLGSTQILVQASDFTGTFITHLATKSITANQAELRELSKERDAAKARELASGILDRMDDWGPLPYLALWRSELGEPSRVSFIAQSNVLTYRVGSPAVNADRVDPLAATGHAVEC